MKEERNVLDELLGTAEEDDLDIGDLTTNDKRNQIILTLFAFLLISSPFFFLSYIQIKNDQQYRLLN